MQFTLTAIIFHFVGNKFKEILKTDEICVMFILNLLIKEEVWRKKN